MRCSRSASAAQFARAHDNRMRMSPPSPPWPRVLPVLPSEPFPPSPPSPAGGEGQLALLPFIPSWPFMPSSPELPGVPAAPRETIAKAPGDAGSTIAFQLRWRRFAVRARPAGGRARYTADGTGRRRPR